MTASRLAGVAWLWLCLMLAPTAHAQGDPGSAPADLPALRERLQLREPMAPRVERVWYGWQTLLADGATGAVLLGLLIGEEEADPIWVALAVWGLATPLIHVAHGNYAHAFASVGLRAGSVAVSFLVFVFTLFAAWGSDDGSGIMALTWVAIVSSVIGVAAIDAGILAYEERTVSPGSATLQLAPFVDRATRTLGLALVGQL